MQPSFPSSVLFMMARRPTGADRGRGGRDGGRGGSGGSRGRGHRGGDGRDGDSEATQTDIGRCTGSTQMNMDRGAGDNLTNINPGAGSSNTPPLSGPSSYRHRGYSVGGFGQLPNKAPVVRIKNNEIDSAPAKRNLLALMRFHWKEGCLTSRDFDKKHPGWWKDVADEFLRYYNFNRDVAEEEEARTSIYKHMHENMRKNMGDEKKRIDDRISMDGGTFEEHRPSYFTEEVWKHFCEYWRSDTFKKRSDTGKAARASVKTPHASGAHSFERRRRDYIKEHNADPDEVDHFKKCHTKKGDSKLISVEAENIVDRYLKICKDKNIDPSKTQLNSWLEAVDGPRKNKILGFPHIKASDILGTSARPALRKGEGGSGRSTMTRIRDDIFMRVVDQTLAHARANPKDYRLSDSEIRLLAQEVVEGDSQLPPDHPVTRETQNAIVRVVIDVLNNIHRTRKDKSTQEGNDDDNDDHGNGDDDNDDHGDGYDSMETDFDRTPPSSPLNPQGGPKIT